jgi:hypothetical protein
MIIRLHSDLICELTQISNCYEVYYVSRTRLVTQCCPLQMQHFIENHPTIQFELRGFPRIIRFAYLYMIMLLTSMTKLPTTEFVALVQVIVYSCVYMNSGCFSCKRSLELNWATEP